MGDALQQAAAKLEAAANDINAIDLSQEQEAVASIVNNVANSLNSLAQALSAARDAFSTSMDQAQPTEAPPAEPQA